jgi:hypothetical protein
MIRRRIYEIIGTLIIGDGLAFLFTPRPHMLIWVDALKLPIWRRLVQWFADHRAAGIDAGAGGGRGAGVRGRFAGVTESYRPGVGTVSAPHSLLYNDFIVGAFN